MDAYQVRYGLVERDEVEAVVTIAKPPTGSPPSRALRLAAAAAHKRSETARWVVRDHLRGDHEGTLDEADRRKLDVLRQRLISTSGGLAMASDLLDGDPGVVSDAGRASVETCIRTSEEHVGEVLIIAKRLPPLLEKAERARSLVYLKDLKNGVESSPEFRAVAEIP